MHLVAVQHVFLPRATQQTTFSNISFEDAEKSLSIITIDSQDHQQHT
jgi:hypothetical protein